MGKVQALLPASQPSTDQPFLPLLRSCKGQWKDPYLDRGVLCGSGQSQSPSLGFAFLTVKLGGWTEVHLHRKVVRLPCHPANSWDTSAFFGPFPRLFLPQLLLTRSFPKDHLAYSNFFCPLLRQAVFVVCGIQAQPSSQRWLLALSNCAVAGCSICLLN